MNETNAVMTRHEERIIEMNEYAASTWNVCRDSTTYNNCVVNCTTVRRKKYGTGKNSLEPNGWAVAAMNVAQRNGLRTLTKHREPPASGARVLQKNGLRF